MTSLAVPGAKLNYHVNGSGPVITMVAGSNGTGAVFARLADHLAPHYTVVLYDRRGFSQSHLDGPQDYRRRLETDADDLRRLIEHVSNEPATIVGISSGAIIALETIARHPSVARTIVPYEPPAMRQLPDGQEWLDFFSELYDMYRTSGIPPAMKVFGERCFAKSDQQVMAQVGQRGNSEEMVANATYWFEHELRQYPPVDLDLDTLKARARRIVPAAGRESRGHPCYEVASVLAHKLDRDLTEMPGGHLGSIAHPAEFAQALMHALDRNTQQIDRTSAPASAERSPADEHDEHRRQHLSTGKEQSVPRAGVPIVLQPGAGPWIQGPVGGPLTFKVRGEQSNGKLAVVENELPPGEGPPVHTHANEDESWYVLNGTLWFVVETEASILPAGSFVFVPSGTTYTFQNVGTEPARILVIFTPAGLETFFERIAEVPRGVNVLEAYKRIGTDFGVDVVAPPLPPPS